MNRCCIFLVALVALTSCKSREASTTNGASTSENSARPADIPDWVPLYPGGKVGKAETHKTPPIETYTQFAITEVRADCVKVTDWYEEKLKLVGFNVVRYAGWTNGYCSANLNADGPGNVHGIRMSADGRDTTTIAISAISREMPGAAPQGAGKVPAWLPQYPGSAPSNLVATESGPEHRVEFNFTTDDDAPKILGWYNQQLRGAGFDIPPFGASDHDYGRLSASKAALIVTVRVEPVGSKRGVFIETRDGVR